MNKIDYFLYKQSLNKTFILRYECCHIKSLKNHPKSIFLKFNKVKLCVNNICPFVK